MDARSCCVIPCAKSSAPSNGFDGAFQPEWEAELRPARDLLKKLIIAIDGPVGSGKSTLARRVAELMGYVYVDTGAMYRARALKALRHGISFEEADDALVVLAEKTSIDLRADDGTQRVLLDREDVTAAIRTPAVAAAAAKIAVNSE